MGRDLGQNDQRIPHLQVLLGLEAHDKAFGELVVPFVADVAEVLVVELFLLTAGGGGGGIVSGSGGWRGVPEHGQKAGMLRAFGFEERRVGVPAHHCLEQAEEETAVAARLVLGEAGYRVGYVGKDAVVADYGAEVGRLEAVYDLNEFRAVVRVNLSEETPTEYAQLQEDCYCLVLGFALF